MTIEISTLVVTPFMQNCRVLFETGSSEAVVIDPGGDAQRIIAELEKRHLIIKEIWLTHAHLDHCGAVAALMRKYDSILFAQKNGQEFRTAVSKVAVHYGLSSDDFEQCPEPHNFLVENQKLRIGDHECIVFETPGHAPDHVVFYFKNDGFVIAGDTLFQGSIGRSDLPGGDHELLIRSIKEKLLILPGATRVLSGHGGDTTIETEIRNNPFLR